MSTPRQQQGGLSITTLAISAAASVAAAIVVHEVWKGGAILGAAITPVVVAIVSETLRKPVDRVSTIRGERRTRTQVRPGQAPPPPAPELERADPFGIWREDRLPWWRRRGTKLGVVTGLIAFVVGAVALTGTELIFGDSIGSGGGTSTLVPGDSSTKSSDGVRTSTTETQTDTEAQTTPTETTPTEPPAETAPTETTPPPTEQVPVPPSPTEPVPPAETPPPVETVPPAEPAPTP